MRRIVLMPDYDADPLWDDETRVMVSLSSLPISAALKDRIREWATRWEDEAWAAINQGDDEDEVTENDRELYALWRELRDELPGQYEVGMFTQPPRGKTKVHVLWEPDGKPELPTWHKRGEAK